MFILVDTENIQITPQEITQIEPLSSVTFFVSRNSKPINPYCIGILESKGSTYNFEAIEYTKATKNCLDLHLVIYLTRKLSVEHPQEEQNYYIYSKDADFSQAALYIEDLTGVKVKVISSFSEISTKGNMEGERQSQIDKIVSECASSCTTLQQAYRYMVKNMRSSCSMTEIASIYNSQKERLLLSMSGATSNMPVPTDSGSTNISAMTSTSIENPLSQSKEKDVSVKLDLLAWHYMKTFMGLANSRGESKDVSIGYKGRNVIFINDSVDFSECTFTLNTLGPIELGEDLHLKCTNLNNLGSATITVTTSTKTPINRFLNAVRTLTTFPLTLVK